MNRLPTLRPTSRAPRRPARLADLGLASLLLAAACGASWVPPAAAAAPLATREGTAPRSRLAPPAPGPRERAVARARAVAADTGAAGRARTAPRMLDDIHIEGEIPVPQVLFITARDQRRFMEFQHHRYQRSSRELGRATPTPSRLVVTAPQPVERKENPR
jgi:hypothetical protein